MSRITTKILKIIIFSGIFAWHVYSQFKKGGAIFSLEVIGAGLGLASLAYISLSLYGFILDISKRYLLAFIITVVIALFVSFKIDGIIASIPWLSEDGFVFIIIVLAVLCVVRDVKTIRTISQIQKSSVTQTNSTDERNT